MRVWLVPFDELDIKRLMASHHEVHPLLQLVKTGRPWLGWQLPEHRGALFDVHDRVIEEAKRRGAPFDHRTPMDPSLMINDVPQVPYPVTDELLARDRWVLVCRWQGVYRGTNAAEKLELYGPLLDRYLSQGGCLHEVEPWELLEDGREMCTICKRAYRPRVLTARQIENRRRRIA